MRGKGAEQHDEGLDLAAGAAVGVELIDHGHECSDSGVHLQLINITADLLDGFVDNALVLLGVFLAIACQIHEIPAPVKETLRALDGLV